MIPYHRGIMGLLFEKENGLITMCILSFRETFVGLHSLIPKVQWMMESLYFGDGA